MYVMNTLKIFMASTTCTAISNSNIVALIIVLLWSQSVLRISGSLDAMYNINTANKSWFRLLVLLSQVGQTQLLW